MRRAGREQPRLAFEAAQTAQLLRRGFFKYASAAFERVAPAPAASAASSSAGRAAGAERAAVRAAYLKAE
ncbi:MAG: hypothetical protein ACLUEK_05445 [Oscillospiraceae bacterium]